MSVISVGDNFKIGVGVTVGLGVAVAVGVGVDTLVGLEVGVGVGPVMAIVDSCDQTEAELQLGVYLPTLNRYSPGPL
jgi:hypothetical protein